MVGTGGALTAALPWQTLVRGQRIDPAALLQVAALPALQRFAHGSLRKPGVALALTTVFDVALALITGGASALPRVIPRLVMGIATTVMSLLTGSKGGGLRKATGVVSALGALVMVATAIWGLVAGLSAGASTLTLISSAVATLSMLAMAVTTTWAAFRG